MMDKGKGKADDQPPKKRFLWRIRSRTAKEERDKRKAAQSQPLHGDT